MFEAVLSNGSILKRLIDAVKDLCKDVNLECSDEGIQIQAMDGSHVALVSMHLKNGEGGAFENYRCDRQCIIGVNMESLTKIFKLCGNDDKVKMSVEDDADTVVFTFENESMEKCTDFTMKQIDLENEHLGIPDQAYNTEVAMPAREYANVCNLVKEFGDTVAINVTKESVTFSVEGDHGQGNIVLRPRQTTKESECICLDVEDPVRLSFALRYLNCFAKAAPLCDTVKLSLSDAVPMVISFNIETAEKGHLNFYLAPKIDE